jgi:bifunctional DNase/RNase
MKLCRLSQIVIDEDEKRQVIFLAEIDGSRRLPIAIGTAEAQAIARAVANQGFPRPLTHDLLLSVLDAGGLALAEVRITDVREGTFFAELHLARPDGNRVVIDCRPSDALALLARRPLTVLLVAETVLAEHA